MEQSSFIKINPADSVVVCLRPMKKGETIEVDGKTITLLQDTPAGHKVLINDAAEGTDILKYGYPIGHAKTGLKAGEWVNENNLKTNLAGTLEYTYNPVNEQLNIAKENRTFKGYVRKNGEVGVRNEVWVVPTVGCLLFIVYNLYCFCMNCLPCGNPVLPDSLRAGFCDRNLRFPSSAAR
jgi:altronate hydrolase